jgi:hypothetical protein
MRHDWWEASMKRILSGVLSSVLASARYPLVKK